jgi:aspartate/methionine/tyrosine aminotransferase
MVAGNASLYENIFARLIKICQGKRVTLPAPINEQDFVREARERGIGVAPGRLFFPQPRREGGIRLSFGAHPPNRIEEGVARLGQVLQGYLRRHQEVIARAGRETGPFV